MRKNNFIVNLFLFFFLFVIPSGRSVLANNLTQIQGQVINSIYTSGNNIFTVSFPFKDYDYDRSKINIKESFQAEKGSYVSFGIDSWNQSIYRVILYNFYKDEELNKIADKLTDRYVDELEKSYNSKIAVYQSFNTEKINNNKARHCILAQNVRFRIKSGPDKDKIINIVFMHDVYVIDYGKSKAVIWVQSPVKQTTKESGLLSEPRVPEISPKAFAESLVIY